jgi:hypothetical protein
MILSDIEFDVLDNCYFINSFDNIFSELTISMEEFEAVIKELLKRKLIHQMIFNEITKDFEKLDLYDEKLIHACNYVISKEGLFIHNGR